MKFIVHMLVIALIAFLLGSIVPYYVMMMLIGAVSAWFRGAAFLAFIAGAIGVASVWVIAPLVIWSVSGSDLPDKFSQIMGFSNGTILVGITGVLGFLIGGFSALTGNFLGKLFRERNAGY
ncbi:hypothetical protein Q4534_07815 [Cyclobacterium sp. 1_MG-2023]|uniref:hypothetical protein n=1 Tax=Cyclobacterium sp. 1_MG-2023 TaxID=3062681 RepID=UPI0026E3EA1E|nr:hypothetical protein [Cyclobacterium sp. 1_MG-2023]MDO6437306.1 hypothetical protein [Cyclobacterium sp. 1_MG-2023]